MKGRKDCPLRRSKGRYPPEESVLIDPPSGWRYGFPKTMPKSRLKDVESWLVENGYPQGLIDEMGDYFRYRIIG